MTGQSLSFQWRKNGVNIPGATLNFYRINNVSASDAGSYDLIVSNSCGSDISSAATLNVHTFSINPSSQNFGASGSTGIVNVTSTGNCDWMAVSNAPFITITSGASGVGNGTVNFTVVANPSAAQRTGSITIAGKSFTVTQDAAAPTPMPTSTPTPTPTSTPTPTPTPTANVVQFSSSNYSVVEDCTTITITVNRIGDTSSAVSVDYFTSDVTASQRSDYITAIGTLRFAPDETSKSFAVLINDDSLVEGNETFNVNLSNPAGAGLGAPAIATVQIMDASTRPGMNVIDEAQNFVCQHYHDFLNREPDAGGLAFWTNEITSCGSNQACTELKRINVSAAYFLSIEFQQTVPRSTARS